MNKNDPINIVRLVGTPEWRAVTATFKGFCGTIFPEAFSSGLSADHESLFGYLQTCPSGLSAIVAYRTFGKTTIITQCFTLWAALEKPERYPFIIIVTHPGNVAIFAEMIQYALLTNPIIKSLYGDMKTALWNKENIVLANGVMVAFRSIGQKIRGALWRNQRPALVIADDIEGSALAVKNKEQRDSVEKYMRSEIIPGIDQQKGLLIVVGNVLHKDSLLPRIEKSNTIDQWQFFRFPLLDGQGKCRWPDRYPTEQALLLLRNRAGNSAWQREYLLRATAEEGQPILEEWIQYYDQIPNNRDNEEFLFAATGIDLAISKKETADYTAMVSILAFFDRVTQSHRFYVDPQPVIARLSFHEAVAAAQAQSIRVGNGTPSIIFVENVGYQYAAIEEMQRKSLPVFPFSPGGQDKRARIISISPYVQSGALLFPRDGADIVINQLLDFGIEEHDDAVDALTTVLLGVLGRGLASGAVQWV